MNYDRPLPLSETTYYILFTLREAQMHGYAIMKKVKELSHDEVIIGAGTLYGALDNLTHQGLIKRVATDSNEPRRKTYELTEAGKAMVKCEFERMHNLVNICFPAFLEGKNDESRLLN